MACMRPPALSHSLAKPICFNSDFRRRSHRLPAFGRSLWKPHELGIANKLLQSASSQRLTPKTGCYSLSRPAVPTRELPFTIACSLRGDGVSEAAPKTTQSLGVKLLAGLVLALAVSCGFQTRAARAVAETSIAASPLGIKVATFLRGSGWPDELIVFAVAMLPVLELRGAIPISYWLEVDPVKGYILAVLGNMVPVAPIVLYLERFSNYLGERSEGAKRLLTWVFERTRRKGGVIEEFKWLGLMLFVAVPFPGTGAWTGAFLASLLGIPFWDAITSNLVGVLLAGLLVNLVVVLGAKYAVGVGLVLFVISTFMWNALRLVRSSKKGSGV